LRGKHYWVAAIKISVNYTNLSDIPGATILTSVTGHRCFREKETLPHVLGGVGELRTIDPKNSELRASLG
jgi:hypothetical protein